MSIPIDDTKVKYWAGWLSPTFMSEPEFIESWKRKAQDAEDSGFDLMVFKIPKEAGKINPAHLLVAIEKLLQETLDK